MTYVYVLDYLPSLWGKYLSYPESTGGRVSSYETIHDLPLPIRVSSTGLNEGPLGHDDSQGRVHRPYEGTLSVRRTQD